MGKQTPLYESHRALGARIVDFSGWDMPLHYGSQIEEHHAVRRHAGMFDVSHMLNVDVIGPAARDYLERLLANDVAKLALPGRALYSCMLTPEGGVIDDLIAYFLGEGRYRLVVNAGTAGKDVAWMSRQAQPFAGSLEVTPRRDLAMIAVQGPQARSLVWQAIPGSREATEALIPFQAARFGDGLIARTGYTGEDGFELVVAATSARASWQSLLDAGVRPAGLGARDTLRLEAGMNLYGQDMDETVTPLESGLAWTVDRSRARDFLGRSALDAAAPARQLIGMILLDKGVLRSHQRVFTAHGDGMITSGSFSPTLGRAIALARLPVGVRAGEEVEVDVRGRRLRAKLVRPPFARHGQALV
ncbi:MAG: glycine cleavage system aminomethyltransferase GcvT [Rhodocyclaceae bacterium]